MSYYYTCPECGANLDVGEKCDCRQGDVKQEGVLCKDFGVDITNTGVALIWSKGGYLADIQGGYALIVAGRNYEELKPVTFMNEWNGRHARFRIEPGMHLIECNESRAAYPVIEIFEVLEVLKEKSVVRTKRIYFDALCREEYPCEAWKAVQAAYYTAGYRNCRKCYHALE